MNTLLALIERLYEVALEPEGWRGFAPLLARGFASTSSVVQVRDLPRNEVALLGTTPNFTAEINRAYQEHYYKTDLWAAAAIKKAGLAAMLGSEEVSDEFFFRSEHYNDFCTRIDVACVLGSVFPLGDGAFGILGIHRPHDVARFEQADKARLNLFLPHLQRGLQMYRRLAGAQLARSTILDALGALDIGVAVVDARCRCIFVNAAVEALARAGGGLAIRESRLSPVDSAARASVEALVASAAAAGAGRGLGAGGALAVPRPEGRPLSLLVCPLPIGRDGFGPAEPMALVFVSDPDRSPPAPQSMLRGLYGLTEAEARLLGALLEGNRLQDYAERNAVTMNTVRTQLAHIFSKTGTSRQAELIRLCLSLPTPYGNFRRRR